MGRKLKFHEKKLLRRTDFITWTADNKAHENLILRRFHIQRREDYTKYNRLARKVREVAAKIALINPEDEFRDVVSGLLLEKLHGLGLTKTRTNLDEAAHLTASHFCIRRLPIVMVKQKLSENIKMAVDLIEHGHIRVGPQMIKDPSYLVTRHLEDFVTWVDGSAIRKHVLQYNNNRDDFEL